VRVRLRWFRPNSVDRLWFFHSGALGRQRVSSTPVIPRPHRPQFQRWRKTLPLIDRQSIFRSHVTPGIWRNPLE
jgi:hypothetical protein